MREIRRDWQPPHPGGTDAMVCLWQFCCRHDGFRRVTYASDTILRWESIEACGLQC